MTEQSFRLIVNGLMRECSRYERKSAIGPLHACNGVENDNAYIKQMNLCSQTNKREAGPSATFSPGSYSGLPPADKYTNFFSYGNKKENKLATEPVIRTACLLPFTTKVEGYVDAFVYTFTQNEVVIVNAALGIVFLAFIFISFRHFFHNGRAEK